MNRTSVLALLLLAVLAGTGFAGTAGPGYRGFAVGSSSANAMVPRTVWANLSAGADATIASAYPDRNFGATTTLTVAANPSTGTVSRALASFDTSSIPPSAQIASATLQVHMDSGDAGAAFEAHRLLAPWVEGTGVDYLYERTVTVTETAGVARMREPVEARIILGTPLALTPRTDFRVFDAAGNEIPSQVNRVAYSGANVSAATVTFESSNLAYQSRVYHVRYGYASLTIPGYRQLTPWVPLWNFSAGTTYASLAAADLDGDGSLETILGSSNGNVYAIHANGSLMWTQNLGASISSPVAVADVNGDGILDVLAMTDAPSNHRIYAITADNRSLWNTGANPGKAAQGPLVIADVNGDGIMEIFAGATDRTIYAFNGSTGATSWTYTLGPGAQAYGGALANFTGGPAPELVFGTSTGVLQALTTSGVPIWSVQPGQNSMLQTPAIGDLDGSGQMDIVAGDRGASGNQFAVWGSNGTTKWITATGTDQSGGNVLVDFGHDGRLETVFAKSTSAEIGALQSDGRWLWNYTTGGTIYSTPAAADLNGDGEEDIAVGSFDNYLYLIASNGSLIQRIPTDSPVRGTPVIADIDGDGTLDIVFATATKTWAYRTPSLGHDTRVGSYNLRNTGRFLDGNSPDGAALLSVSVGAEVPRTGTGVSWTTRDGTNPWNVPGGEYASTADGSSTIAIGGWTSVDLTALVGEWVRQTAPNLGVLLRLTDETASAQAVASSRESGAPGPILAIVYSVNSGPQIVSRIPDQAMPEDSAPWTLNLYPYGAETGLSPDQLSWDLAGTNSSLYEYTGGNVTGNPYISFQPKPNAFGDNRVTVFLFDPMGRFASQSIWVNLTPVNDAPTFSPPTAFYVHYGVPYTFNFTPYISDPDNPIDQLYLTVNDTIHATVSGHNVTFLYPQDMTDTWQFVTITVSDGLAFTPRTVAVKVTSDYPPEIRKKLPNLTLQEGETRLAVFDLDEYFYDPDNDTLFYTFGFSHLNITIHPDHTVDVQAVQHWWGVEWVTFRATDPTGALLEDSISVTVTPVNDPPVISGVPPLVVHFDYPYNFDLTPYITDPDTPISQIAVSTSDPTHVRVSGRVMTLLYPDLGTGPYTVTLVINVTDGLGYSFWQTTVTATNDYPPVLRKTLPDVIFLEDTVKADAFNLDDYFYDNDSATVFYTSGQVHVTVTIDPRHNVSFSAEANWNGIETVRFRATDDRGAIAEDTIKVIVEPVDDAPVITPWTWQDQIRDRHSWFLDLSKNVSDVDTNESLLLLTVTSAAGAGYVQAAGLNLLFSYPDSVMSDTVTVTAHDDQGLASNTVTIRVQIRGPDLFGILLPWIAAGLLAATSVVIWSRVRPQVEEVFLVHANGIPIAHLSRTLKAEKDTDLVTSMFTTIQNFTNDIFRARGAGDLNALQLGDYRLSVARGESAFLVVLYHGRQSRGIERKAREVVNEVESQYGTVLANWNGDVEQLAGVKEFMERFFKAKAQTVLERRPTKRLGGLAGLGGEVTGLPKIASDPPLPETLPPPPPPTD